IAAALPFAPARSHYADLRRSASRGSKGQRRRRGTSSDISPLIPGSAVDYNVSRASGVEVVAMIFPFSPCRLILISLLGPRGGRARASAEGRIEHERRYGETGSGTLKET